MFLLFAFFLLLTESICLAVFSGMLTEISDASVKWWIINGLKTVL